MSYSIAPAAKAALEQATKLWPKRSRASDGLVGDPAHASRRSFHNPSRPDGTPDPDGKVYAFDLTHDPDRGCDAHALVRAAVARKDRRVMEAISQGKIWTKARAAEGWRTYSGSNAHNKHAHVTVDPRYSEDVSPWWTVPAKPVQPVPAWFRRGLEQGAQGSDVAAMQSRLHLTADGVFGPQTKAAVVAVQKKHGLVANGIVRSDTARVIG